MKKRHIYISILFFLFHLLSIQAQRNNGNFRIFDEEFDILSGLNDCCNTESVDDITFGYDLASALYNQQLIKDAMLAHLNTWRIRQEGILKEEIERQLYKTFPNFTEARNTYFNKIENDNINRYKGEVANKYSNKTVSGYRNQRKYLRNLKMLKLRENEIISGNINNSLYVNLNYNGTPLSQINSINQLNSLWISEVGLFSSNNSATHINKNILEYLNGISSANNYSHSIFTELLYLHLQYYNSFSVWDRINLMQAYLQHINDPLLVVQPVQLQQYAGPTFIDNYAVSHREGGLSIFDPQYPVVNNFIYSNNPCSNFIDYNLWEQDKAIALNNLLNTISTNELKIQSVISTLSYDANSQEAIWLNAHIGQGVQIFDFLGNNPTQEEIDFVFQAIISIISNNISSFSSYINLVQTSIINTINNIENGLSSDPIELYLIALNTNSNLLNLSVFGRSSSIISVGEYSLTPHYDINNNLVFYAAIREDSNLGIEYIIKVSSLQLFQDKINLFTSLANLFYINGIPTNAQINVASGNYYEGLTQMWYNAIHSSEWWAFAIISFGQAIINLPQNTTIGSSQTSPNWKVSLNEMTNDLFQGKVVTNSNTGISVTITIPDDYLPQIANNGNGILFQPANSIGNNNLIKIMQPTNLYPKGYVRFYNQYGQPMENPQINTNPGSNSTTHFQFN